MTTSRPLSMSPEPPRRRCLPDQSRALTDQSTGGVEAWESGPGPPAATPSRIGAETARARPDDGGRESAGQAGGAGAPLPPPPPQIFGENVVGLGAFRGL